MRKSKISYKIFFTVSSVFFALFLLSGWISYTLVNNVLTTRQDEFLQQTVHSIRQTVETSASLANRSYLGALAEHCLKITQDYYQQHKQGETAEDVAMQAAIESLSSLKIGTSGYTYIVNSSGVIQAHPVAAYLQQDFSTYPFIREQMQRRNGIVHYSWKNPGEVDPRPKILYMKYFEPWDWIISVTLYLDELSQLIDPEDFKELVVSIRVAESGYVIVLDQNGKVLIHQESSEYDVTKDESVIHLRKALAVHDSGRLFFNSRKSETQEEKEKILVYETSDALGWIIAASGFTDEFYRPIALFKRLQLTLFPILFILSLLVSLYLSRSITMPLKSLLAHLSQKSKFFSLQSIAPPSANEIEEISGYFSEYLKQIEQQNQRLTTLLAEKEKTAKDLSIYKEVFDNLAEGITITDRDGNILRVNTAFEKITGYPEEEAIGENPRILRSGRHDISFYKDMWEMILSKGFWTGKIWNSRKNGEIYPEYLTISAVKNDKGVITHFAAVFIDITESVEQEERIKFLAYHDHLTQLPNRLLIQEKLEELISECRRANEQLICFVCDIDHFRVINDSMGQGVGDAVLLRFVEILKKLVRLEDLFGRFHGDEFVILAKSDKNPSEQAIMMLRRFFAAFDSPIRIEEKDIHLTLSFGISIFPNDAPSNDVLLKRAILALNNAIRQQGNSYRFFDSVMEQDVVKKITYLSKIREGLQKSEFLPYYQPKVNLGTGDVYGMEALARWESGDGLVSPADFISVAEESGLILDISHQLYEKAFKDTAQLVEAGYDLKLSVNISPLQLHSEHFLADFMKIQEESGLAVKRIELEITESLMLEDMEYVNQITAAIANAGFSISIDDFGTGYSSLQYLKKLSFDTLKIDMSFVSGIGNDRDDEQLVRTIALLAKQFGMEIVAEGVEIEEQANFLKMLGCNYGQGYYYSKPLGIEDFKLWLKERSSAATF